MLESPWKCDDMLDLTYFYSKRQRIIAQELLVTFDELRVHERNTRSCETPEVDKMYIFPLTGVPIARKRPCNIRLLLPCSEKHGDMLGAFGISVSTPCGADRGHDNHRCTAQLVPRA